MQGLEIPIEIPKSVTADQKPWHKVLAEAKAGRCLLVSGYIAPRKLSTLSLAQIAVCKYLEVGSVGCTHLMLQSTGRRSFDFPGGGYGHELAWWDTGYLFEKLSGIHEADDTWTHVICLDPWTASLSATRPKFLPSATWVFVSDLDSQSSHEAEYWREMQEWLQIDNFDFILGARELVELLPSSFWQSGNSCSLKSEVGPSNRPVVLIDECEGKSPDTEFHRKALDWAPEGTAMVLLSPYFGGNSPEHEDYSLACSVALDPGALSPSTYASLLASCDLYIAPTGLPFGCGPLRNLSENAMIHVVGIPQNGITYPQKINWYSSRDSLLATICGSSSNGHFNQDTDTVEARVLPVTHGGRLAGKGTSEAIKFSVVTCCYKFLQRLRIFLYSISRQNFPKDQFQVCIASPGNPDGLLEYLDLFKKVHPDLDIQVASVPTEWRTNRGKMINAAFRKSSGSLVMIADCDLVLPPDFFNRMASDQALGFVRGCWRTPLSEEITAHILTGNLDPVDHFEELKRCWDPKEAKDLREGILGYCQVLQRDCLVKVPYPEEFDQINQSDIVFLERLGENLQVKPKMLQDLYVLHLAHHRDWTGTKTFL